MSYANNSLSEADALWRHPAVFGFRAMFYLVTPNESSFQELKDVPKIVDQYATPWFFVFILLERIILQIQRSAPLPRLNDAFSSLAAGVVSQMPLIFMLNIELLTYRYIHQHYCLFELPWNSPLSWWLCMLGVDLGYYWVHRCAHELNFMWAGHQTHHSSEDYNLTTALRQGIFQRYSSWIFYLPLALFLPTSLFATHIQFNLIYQFWIHTQIVDRLGPLEWIMNTPSHHRVHHGRNRYCIDKNYAGVLIIWDRMFGTFEPEKKSDPVVYGLTHPLNSWNPIYTQVLHWQHIVRQIFTIDGFWNKLFTMVKGPGWSPGKPRLGDIEDLEDVHAPMPKYNNNTTTLLNAYCWIHFIGCMILYTKLMQIHENLQLTQITLGAVFILWTLTNVGFFYDRKWYAGWSELSRCVCSFLLLQYSPITLLSATTMTTFKITAAIHVALWMIFATKTPRSHEKLD